MASASKRSATDNNDIAPRPIKVTKKFPEDYTESRVVYFGPNGGSPIPAPMDNSSTPKRKTRGTGRRGHVSRRSKEDDSREGNDLHTPPAVTASPSVSSQPHAPSPPPAQPESLHQLLGSAQQAEPQGNTQSNQNVSPDCGSGIEKLDGHNAQSGPSKSLDVVQQLPTTPASGTQHGVVYQCPYPREALRMPIQQNTLSRSDNTAAARESTSVPAQPTRVSEQEGIGPITSQTVIEGAEESDPDRRACGTGGAFQFIQGLSGNSHSFAASNNSPRTCGATREGQNGAQYSSQPTNGQIFGPNQGIQFNHPPGQQAAATVPNDEIASGFGRESALQVPNQALSLSSRGIADIDDAERQELMMLGLKVKKHREHQQALRQADEQTKQHTSDLEETESRLASESKLLGDINRQIESLEHAYREVQQGLQDMQRLAGVKKDILAEVMRSRDCHREEALGIWKELELSHPLHEHM